MKNYTQLRPTDSTHSPYATVIAISLLLGCLTLGAVDVNAMSQQMDIGSRGADVTTLQEYLSINDHNYPSGFVTGYFGTTTQAGVEKFQTNQGIVSEGTPETTGYGRVGPLTLARFNSLMNFTSGTVSVVRPTPTGDVNAPMMSQEVITVGRNSATIRWNTSESAMHRVMYTKTFPIQYATAESVRAGGYTTAAQATITGLESNTTYYYILESIDPSGNITWTVYKTFRTS